MRVFPWQRWVPAVSWCGLQCDLLSHTGLFANSSFRAEETLQIKVPTPCALETVQRHTRLLALFIVCGCWRLLSQFLISSWSVVSQNGQKHISVVMFRLGSRAACGLCAPSREELDMYHSHDPPPRITSQRGGYEANNQLWSFLFPGSGITLAGNVMPLW